MTPSEVTGAEGWAVSGEITDCRVSVRPVCEVGTWT